MLVAGHDAAGFVGPDEIAPFDIAILNLKAGDSATDAACGELYKTLSARGYDVLLDDTDNRPGAKFATADLIGMPWQIIVGPKGLADGKVELKRRSDGSRELLSQADALERFKERKG